MDIFAYAKENNADYMDMSTGYIYGVRNYNMAKKFGLPTQGIEVYNSEGDFIGVVRERDE